MSGKTTKTEIAELEQRIIALEKKVSKHTTAEKKHKEREKKFKIVLCAIVSATFLAQIAILAQLLLRLA